MENNFTITEVRLIQKFLSRKTDAEIADLLDKPVEAVSNKIAELAGVTKKISLDEKTRHRTETKAQTKKARERRKKDQELKKKLDDQYDIELQKRKKQRLALEQQQAQRRLANSRSQFKTKQVDYSQLITVRIDHKTIIYAKPGQDIEKLKQSFRKALSSNTDHYQHKA